MHQLLGEIQFSLLPLGALLLVAVGVALGFYRHQLGRHAVAVVLTSGALGGLVLVASFYAMRLIPWAMPCLNCLARHEWYSVLLTWIQGWGFTSAAVLCGACFRRWRTQR